MSWIVLYKTEEEVLADGYSKCIMDMSVWYVKYGHPNIYPITGGYGLQDNNAGRK